ncbi:MAG: biotin--[acetyl-CoA-carboxylase] ligase [Cytophagaceae bacterium SCN 52-12]|nr:MAG: biotin--[acetyl-CoA-carboxylase] ligase [Cytophagaceae bacterium SCN 52-12]
MYKPASKTTFIGKNIYYLTSCHSTNDIAAGKVRSGLGENGDVIIADEQTAGRGMQGNTWEAEPGSNFMFSIILKPENLSASAQFGLSQCIALGVRRYVHSAVGAGAAVKWPNDVMVGNRKIAGILIENTLRGAFVTNAVVGIGLNINQTQFSSPRVTSLALETGVCYSLEKELEQLLLHVEECYGYLALPPEELDRLYTGEMLGVGEVRTFVSGGEYFSGIITGVTPRGRLKVITGDGEKEFEVKEIAWVW